MCINKLLFTFFFVFCTSISYSQIDKTNYTRDEIYEKIDTLDWQYSTEQPIINDDDSKSYIDLRSFPFVKYLADSNQAKQYEFWINGYESEQTKFIFQIFPSEEETNYDSIFLYVDLFNNVGYVDGADWANVDSSEELQKRWKAQQKLNEEIIANGYNPVTKIEWFIEPTFQSDKGYVYQSFKVHYEGDYYVYNTWLYLLGRSGYQFMSLVFDEDTSKYVDETFINEVLDSIVFEKGNAYFEFKAGDEVSSTSAADLVTTEEEKKLISLISTDLLCVDVISPNKRGNEISELHEGMILGLVSGYNIYDYFIQGEEAYEGNSEDLLNQVIDYCKKNPSDSLIISVLKSIQ